MKKTPPQTCFWQVLKRTHFWDEHLGFFLNKTEMEKIVEALKKQSPDDDLAKELESYLMQFDRIKIPEVSE